MKYTTEKLFEFMDSERPVKVICADGQEFTGKCWARSAAFNKEEEGVAEDSLEVNDIIIYASEIQSVSYID